MSLKRKKVTIVLAVLCLLCILAAAVVFGADAYVKKQGGKWILDPEESEMPEEIDCILVLGCGVKPDGNPSDMLADRIRRGVELYQAGAAPKLLMSGDHGREEYNEVGTMKKIAVGEGIPDSDVFMDHAGFSTYESMARARDVFGAKKVLIVSQRYHLYRAVYIARALGLEAYGVPADYHTYRGQTVRDLREVLARGKDLALSVLQPPPTYLGDTIPIDGDGNLTND